MNKKRAMVILIGLLVVVVAGLLIVKKFSNETKAPTEVADTIKAPAINMGQISLYLQGNDQLFGHNDQEYAKYKQLIEQVIYTIEGPALNGALLDEGDMESATEKAPLTPEKLPTINEIKNGAIGIGSYLLENVNVKTKYKPEGKTSIPNTSIAEDGTLIINTDHIVIAAGSYYRGLVFTRHSYDSKKWSAWQADKDQLMKLVEVLRLGSDTAKPAENVKVK